MDLSAMHQSTASRFACQTSKQMKDREKVSPGCLLLLLQTNEGCRAQLDLRKTDAHPISSRVHNAHPSAEGQDLRTTDKPVAGAQNVIKLGPKMKDTWSSLADKSQGHLQNRAWP